MKHVLGIDVAKAKLDVALRLPNGKFRSKVIPNNPQGFEALAVWLTRHNANEGLHVCMEATGVYGEAVAEFLADAGHTVSVVNPAQIKAFGAASMVRTKTDKVDAKLIAEFCLAQRPEPWQAPSPAIRELRALVARRNALDAIRVQEHNRLLVANAEVQGNIQEHLDYLVKAIAEIEEAIRRKIDEDPTLKEQRELLDSIPGLGDKTIPVLLAYYGGPLRFHKARRPPPLPDWIHASMSREAVCAESRVCQRSVTPCCARRCICPLWLPSQEPLGGRRSETAQG